MTGSLSRRVKAALRINVFVFSAILALGSFAGSASAAPEKVIELFTSQGCSSCPPADRLAEKLVRQEKGVLTLLMPVDYWDYLGWKDTLASPVFSARQRAYAAHRGDRSVYTPQMVINGEEHVVGSQENAVRGALKRTEPFTTSVELKVTDMAVEASVDGALPNGKMATVYFLRIDDRDTVDIGRGENAGRQVTYVNVVRALEPIGMYSGGHEVFRMPKAKLMPSDTARCAVLIQIEDDDGPGQIVGAATLNWNSGS